MSDMPDILPTSSFKFLGKPFEYWYELNARAESLDYKRLIEEIVDLKMRLAYYEQILVKIERAKDK